MNDLKNPLHGQHLQTPNISRHGQGKRAADFDKFILATKEDLQQMYDNEVCTLTPCNVVPTNQQIVRAYSRLNNII